MNGKLIVAVLLALLLVGAAVTIVNAQGPDNEQTNDPSFYTDPPRDTTPARDPGTTAPVTPAAKAPVLDEDDPFAPTPANHTGGHDDTGDGGNGTGNETDDGDNGTEDDVPGGGGAPCHCPDSRPQSSADAAIQKEGEFQDVAEENADRVRFIVNVSNVGSGTLFNVGVVDELPDLGSTWFAGGPDGNHCTIDQEMRAVCMFGDLAPGANRSVVFSSFNCEFGCGEDLKNTARVFADNDGNPDNDMDSATLPLPPCPADPAVRKQGEVVMGEERDPALANDQVFFFIDVKNFGDGTARNVTLRDELPMLHGSDWFVSGEDADQCVVTQNTLVCNFGDMAGGETRHLTIESSLCHVNCGDEIENTVVISSPNDVDTSNNSDTVVVTPPDCPDAAVQKDATVADSDVDPHMQTVTYTFLVTSVGEATVTNVVLTDELPDYGVDYRLGGPDAFDCVIDEDNVLTCEFGDLRPGAERKVTATAHACEIGCGEDIVNVAGITSDNDMNPGNDQDEAVVERDPCGEGGPEGGPDDQSTGREEETS